MSDTVNDVSRISKTGKFYDFKIRKFYGCRKIAIVGKGAVGSAISRYLDVINVGYDQFDSSDIDRIFEEEYDLLIYAGVRASKYFADRNVEKDYLHCLRAYDTFERIDATEKILVSSIDCSDKFEGQSAYGRNRRMLERKVLDDCANAKVLRLPALFGTTVKKNAWYDSVKGADLVKLSEEYQSRVEEESAKNNLESRYNILSFVNRSSVFCWYNLDTIGYTIYSILNSNFDLFQCVSYDDENESLIFNHGEMIEKFGYYHIAEISDVKSIDYESALIDQSARLIFEKSEVSMFDEIWKEMLN